VQLTRLFGRESELAELADVVDRERLVSLVGAPGCGKTRLAIELGARLTERFPGGVWFVDLAPVADGASVARTVSTVLGVREQAGRAVVETLVDVLGDSAEPFLLLVDNCEHVVDAVAGLCERLVTACRSARVLATSRVALGLAGEQVWEVPPLPVEPGVQLFLDRATLTSSRFRLPRGDETTVEDICARLDGLPLAIELAAASTRLLSVGQIVDRLGQALPLHPRARRGASPRHETMAATVEWSLRLLGPAEQQLFRRLSVFAGGFDLDAAEAVAGMSGDDALDGLSTLVEHSLVVAEDTGSETMRYRLLEPVRQSVAGELAAGGEAEAIRRRHAEHYLALAQRFDPLGVRRVSQPLPLASLEREEANLLAALGWARTQPSDLALRLCGALAPFWEFGGRVNDGRTWLAEALADPAGHTSDPRLRATALGGAGLLAWRHGDYPGARALLEERLALAIEVDDVSAQAASHCTLGRVAFAEGRGDDAVDHCERGIALARSAGDQVVELWGLVTFGWARLVQGDLATGEARFQEALATNEAVGNASVRAHAHNGLQYAAMLAGDAAAMRVHVAGALAAMRAGGTLDETDWLGAAIPLARAEGRVRSVHRLVGAIGAMGRRRGSEHPEAVIAPMVQDARSSRRDVGKSRADRLEAEGARMSWPELVAEALAEPRDDTDTGTDHPLTSRELEVARLVGDGLTNVEIAKQLSISRRTVETHVDHIRQKLHVPTRQQIVVWSLRRTQSP